MSYIEDNDPIIYGASYGAEKKYVCFYTGIEATKRPGRPNGSVRRHEMVKSRLVPKTLTSSFYRDCDLSPQTATMRTALADKINVIGIYAVHLLIGRAPIAVRFALRDHLRSFCILPIINEHDQIEMYAKMAAEFLDTYKVGDKFPWQWNLDLKDEIVRKPLREAYMNLLTPEELATGMYVQPRNEPRRAPHRKSRRHMVHDIKVATDRAERYTLASITGIPFLKMSGKDKQKVHKENDYICFYTGMECAAGNHKTWRKINATVEHLIGQKDIRGFFHRTNYQGRFSDEYKEFARMNVVTCSNQMNSIVDRVPIKIKFMLKEYLATLVIPDELDEEAKHKIYCDEAYKFLENYKRPRNVKRHMSAEEKLFIHGNLLDKFKNEC